MTSLKKNKFSNYESIWKTIFEIYNITTIIRICNAKIIKQYSKTLLEVQLSIRLSFF